MAWTRLETIADAAGVDVAWLNRWLRDEIRRRRAAAGPAHAETPLVAPTRRCRSCGGELERRSGRGRPRTFCTACIPAGSAAAVAKAWRRVTHHAAGKADSRAS